MLLDIVHFLHLASAVVWAGGAIFVVFVLEPTLLRLEPMQIRSHMRESARFAGPVMAISGLLLVITGVARAWAGGGIGSPADLLQPYGLWTLAALVIAVGITVQGGKYRSALMRLLDGEGDFRTALRPLQRRNALVTGGGIAVIIVIMTILGLGLY